LEPIPKEVLVTVCFVALCLLFGMVAGGLVKARVRRWVRLGTATNVVRYDHLSKRGFQGTWLPWPSLAYLHPRRIHPLAWLIIVASLFLVYQMGLLPSVLPRQVDLTGRVTHVRDGDTIEVSGTPVRFAGLDCKELRTPRGDKAKRRMQALSLGKMVSCDLTGRRSYDRVVGTCSLQDGTDLTRQMIREGYCERWW
jgi:endonuclease YncB( thermonuclease family)